MNYENCNNQGRCVRNHLAYVLMVKIDFNPLGKF